MYGLYVLFNEEGIERVVVEVNKTALSVGKVFLWEVVYL